MAEMPISHRLASWLARVESLLGRRMRSITLAVWTGEDYRTGRTAFEGLEGCSSSSVTASVRMALFSPSSSMLSILVCFSQFTSKSYPKLARPSSPTLPQSALAAIEVNFHTPVKSCTLSLILYRSILVWTTMVRRALSSHSRSCENSECASSFSEQGDSVIIAAVAVRSCHRILANHLSPPS